MRRWIPKTRKMFAFKFSLYPSVLLTSQFASPLTYEIFDMGNMHRMGLIGTFKGVFVLSIVLAPFFYGIGYWISKQKIKT